MVRFRASSQKGFTLVEVMVAVAVIAIALPALLFAINTAVDGTAMVREKAIAAWVAENTLTELNLRNRKNGYVPASVATGKTEMAGDEWSYQITPQKTPYDKFIRVDIQVWRGEREESPLVVATGFFYAQ